MSRSVDGLNFPVRRIERALEATGERLMLGLNHFFAFPKR